MARQLVVYDAPVAGFPYLVVVLDNEPVHHVLYARAAASREEADAHLLWLGDLLESQGLDALKQASAFSELRYES